MEIFFTLKRKSWWKVFTALQPATGHWQAANVTSGSLESAKPDIKDVKLAFKNYILSTRKKKENHGEKCRQLFSGTAAANQGPQPLG